MVAVRRSDRVAARSNPAARVFFNALGRPSRPVYHLTTAFFNARLQAVIDLSDSSDDDVQYVRERNAPNDSAYMTE